MMRALMDDVAVRTDAGGTVVRMSRRLGRGSPRRGPAPAALGAAGARVALTRHRNEAGGVVVVAQLSGEIDHAAAPGLLARLKREVAAGDELIVDLQEVPFIDSAGTRLVVDLVELTGAERVRLVVRRGSIAHRALDLAGLAAAPSVELEALG
jgi:anti-anti-sigma factor